MQMLNSTYSFYSSFDSIAAATNTSNSIAVVVSVVTMIAVFYGFYQNSKGYPPGPSRSPFQPGNSSSLQPYQIFSALQKHYGMNYMQSSYDVNLDIFTRSYFLLLSGKNPRYR